MPYEISTYKGDATYSVCCTGDVVAGDSICFERATFYGSFRNSKWGGYERVCAVVLRESYGKDKMQHTFTLELPDKSTIRIKGRNLYDNGVWRAPWVNEQERTIIAEEKHQRGDAARRAKKALLKSVY